jgi:hypothetical protein
VACITCKYEVGLNEGSVMGYDNALIRGERPIAQSLQTRLEDGGASTMAELSRAACYCVRELRDRGWTEDGIGRFLGDPDRTAPNPRYRNSAPMRLYARRRVHQAESTPEWQAWRDGRERRRPAAQRAVETKRAKLLAALEAQPLPALPVLSREALRQQAYAHWRSLSLDRGREPNDGPGTESNDEFQDRLCVNYLRHECSDYENRLLTLYGQTGREEGYELIRNQIDDAIMDQYPYLIEACARAMR